MSFSTLISDLAQNFSLVAIIISEIHDISEIPDSGRLDSGSLDARTLGVWTLDDWTLGLWTPGHLDAWKLGLWTPGRLDTGQPNAWTLDLWTLGPHVRIFKDLIVKLILWTAIVSNVAIFRSFIYRKKFLLWEIELSIFKHPSRKSGCRVLVLVKLKTDCSE